ncbi:MAG: cbb3-type cytochrome c oxidase subunit I, partial [Flavobacteriaceae bacterium]|nr:cbb3-type cytochrome c oxidase subunit I [Flavobacteriaceae bacterium]
MKRISASQKLKNKVGKYFIILALVLLGLSSIFGALNSLYYVFPDYLKPYLGFEKLRPMHVSAAVFWILSAATGFIYFALEKMGLKHEFKRLKRLHLSLWILALLFIFFSYSVAWFGGREYWEFPPFIAILIAIAWLIFLYILLKTGLKIKSWPVYLWMWATGVGFFFFIFLENYLWIHPYFRTDFLKDMLIQWKAAGSLVGTWNMLIYGSAIFLMERISKNRQLARNKWAFALFFLSLFNMLFNWGHHLYLVPVHPAIHYTGYIVSMTEWVFLIKIFYTWKNQLTEAKTFHQYYPYRYLLAANFWVCANLILALLMSIPVLNLYMHGTHIIVAHAMGTTIGINS